MDKAGEGEDNGNIKLAGFIFMQPPILKVLFEQLPAKDLAKCRLVNKLWYSESVSAWRSNATLKLKMEEGWIISTRGDGTRRTTSLGEFLDLWEGGELGLCQFKKFHLHSWKFEAGDVEQERFLELVGGHITSLTLNKCAFSEREDFRRILFQAFPKLQFLKMTNFCQVDGVYWHQLTEEEFAYKEPAFGVHGLKSLDISNCRPHSMMDMLSHFHKLESLHVEVGGRSYPYGQLLETIRLIRAQDQTKLPLKNFDVKFEFRLEATYFYSSMFLLKFHEQLNLPLQHLEICFSKEVDDRNLRNDDVVRDLILKHHSSTLTYLELVGDGGRDGFFNSFPFGSPLENLETLVIRSYRFCDNLNYLKYMPNLRTFKLQTCNSNPSEKLFSNSEQLEIGDWTLPKLTELEVCYLSPCNLGKLMKWMPNVECLRKIELNDVKFAMVCKNWRNLKYLEEFGAQLTDKGVIGMENANEGGGDEGGQGGPNITNLKSLISFESWSHHLTSASIHDGFLKLANLKELSFCPQSMKLDGETKAVLQRRKIRCNI